MENKDKKCVCVCVWGGEKFPYKTKSVWGGNKKPQVTFFYFDAFPYQYK